MPTSPAVVGAAVALAIAAGGWRTAGLLVSPGEAPPLASMSGAPSPARSSASPVGAVSPSPHASSPAYGTYAWPVRGPVVRGFEPPESTFGAGHRGIDIEVPFGTRVGASASGIVAFAGTVAGSLFVSIDHPDGVRTTYSWLSDVAVRRGETVERGETIGATGSGHPGSVSPHLHFGARIGDTYIDPMLLLERGSIVGLVHLAPLDPPADREGVDP